MPNPNPKIEHLRAAPGTKTTLNTKPVTVRLTESEKSKVEFIAERLGCIYDGSGSLTRLLSAIAAEKFIIVQTPNYIRFDKINTPISDSRSKKNLPIIANLDDVIDPTFEENETPIILQNDKNIKV